MRPIRRKRKLYIGYLFTATVILSIIQFTLNPLGLGLEPDEVLTEEFFENPLDDSEDVELLIDGQEAFDTMLGIIDSATSSVHVQTFIWKDDTIGGRVASSLDEAAARGGQVSVSKDVLGTV